MVAADAPVDAVRGIGTRGRDQLAAEGVRSVGDLLWWLPRRWEDRSDPVPVASVTEPAADVTLCARVVRVRGPRGRFGRNTVVEAVVEDDTGALPVVWFNQPYLARTFASTPRLWLHGAVREGRGGRLQLVAPEWEVEPDEGPPEHRQLVPVYRRIGPLAGRRLRRVIAAALDQVDRLDDPVAAVATDAEAPLGLLEALRSVHAPDPGHDPEERRTLLRALAGGVAPAQRRLALHELCGLTFRLELERERRRGLGAHPCTLSAASREAIRRMLPFALTGAQKRVVREIVEDLGRPAPMARLLQGDVGAGKTVVAALASLVVIESGLQVAFLAPTELLAQQHAATLGRLLGRVGRQPELLTGSLSASDRRRVLGVLAGGDAGCVVGTHALIQEGVAIPRLGLVIVDEQHRFGAAQRRRLVERAGAGHPHLLVMTATPIPRSLALAAYGDLDISVLDELPPGRQPVRTVVRGDDARPGLYRYLRGELADGGQVFWVFPLVEGSETVEARDVESHVETVRAHLPGVRVEAVHGRMPAAVRSEVMRAFADREIGVLCATTVIEVGVDVPGASVMVVENAERFGLAQLHQLRGRVGRGLRRAVCVLLVGSEAGEASLRRLEVVAATDDGFTIAEEDFRQRGPGEIGGLRQWGQDGLRVARLDLHRPELRLARVLAGRARRAGTLAGLARGLPGADGESIAPG